jgi:hypothetical protein
MGRIKTGAVGEFLGKSRNIIQ